MSWSKEHIDAVARLGADADYRAFERIGLDGMNAAHVLDVGCFDGFNTVLKFAPYAGLSKIVGIDPLQDAIDDAKDTTTDARFSWECTSLQDYAPDDSFDLVYFSHVLQHLDDKKAAIQKAYALLNPGGSIVIKAVDDFAKLSHPDGADVMRRLFRLYEEHVLPRVAHTAHTDRNFGAKCPALLRDAGFVHIALDIVHTNTAGMPAEQRRALFERMTYFRRAKPRGLEKDISQEIDELLAQWESMFEDEGYLFDTPTFVITARKPDGGHDDDVLESEQAMDTLPIELGGGISAQPMHESHLGQVMAIETTSFPDPWSPLAYVSELRYNRDAHYEVIVDHAGTVLGYVGVWVRGDESYICQIAVAKSARRQGLGRLLVIRAGQISRACGAHVLRLTVRESNAGALAFYKALGFRNIGTLESYYANPLENGLEMAMEL